MPRGRRSFDADSDSSSSSSHHYDRGNHRNNRHNKPKFSSSCGIKSVNEYWDQFTDTDHKRASADACADDGSSMAFAGASAANHQNGCFSSEANAGVVAVYDGNLKAGMANAGANAEFGLGGAIAEADADLTAYCFEEDDGRIEVGKGYVGGGLGLGAGGVKAKAEAGIDAVNVSAKLGKNQEMSANVGLNVDTGVEFGVDGVSVSFLGIGVSAGRNTGISTPFGGISFKLW
ncbi:uncharacterized protein LOC117530235 [Thalassophryne amazonica]|uniref:uncharacterized protein LOC117530235 n=1 Tax=Thalassophryne amazonica TaxID=390379 RepID=UPI001471E6D7|nr:uncharacterized protein LOC117530235 [Thalassophryne amazonica]